jgi:hypothetical protein
MMMSVGAGRGGAANNSVSWGSSRRARTSWKKKKKKPTLTAWLPLSDAWNLGVGDVLDRVSTPRVLGDANVVVIWHPVCRVVNDVLEDGTKLDGAVDLWLLCCREVDALCVTTTLDVEDAGV